MNSKPTTRGELYIGISDAPEIVGTSISDESLQQWINQIKSSTTPSIVLDAEVLQYQNLKVVLFKVTLYPSGVNGGVNDLLTYIQSNPGQKTDEIKQALQIPQRTLERYLKKTPGYKQNWISWPSKNRRLLSRRFKPLKQL